MIGEQPQQVGTEQGGAPFLGWWKEARAAGWLLGGDTAARVAGQVAIVISARLLGPEKYGELAVGLAALSICVVLCDFGLGDAAVLRFTDTATGGADFLREVAPLRLLLSLPLVPVGLLLVALPGSLSLNTAGVLISAAPLAVLMTNRVLFARVEQNFPVAAGWNSALVLSQWFGALFGVLVWRSSASAALGVVSGMLIATSPWWFRRGPVKVTAHPRARLRAGLPFLITAGAVVLYSRGDRVVVALFTGASAAGAYTAAYNLVMTVAIAGAALHAAILPRLLREHRLGATASWPRRALKLALVAAPVSIALWFISPLVVEAAYGKGYAPAGEVLRILSPLVVLYLLNPFLSSCILAAGRQKTLAAVAVANLLLACTIYPLLTMSAGARGIAAASVIVEFLGTMLCIGVLVRGDRRLPVLHANKEADVL